MDSELKTTKKNRIFFPITQLLATLFFIMMMAPYPCNAEPDIYFYIDKDGNHFYSNVPTIDHYIPSELNFIKPSSSSGRPANDTFDLVIQQVAKIHQVDFALVKAIIKAESGFNPTAVSHAGAQGLMQIMPANFESFGIANAFDPEENIRAGTRYLRYLMDRYDQNLHLALAAYNAGPTAVDRYEDIPPFRETREYVKRVLSYYDHMAHTR